MKITFKSVSPYNITIASWWLLLLFEAILFVIFDILSNLHAALLCFEAMDVVVIQVDGDLKHLQLQKWQYEDNSLLNAFWEEVEEREKKSMNHRE